jgi:hypothetical protein
MPRAKDAGPLLVPAAVAAVAMVCCAALPLPVFSRAWRSPQPWALVAAYLP